MKRSYILKNGCQLSYTDYGTRNGYPVLIQHGLIASIEEEDVFESLIRSHARLICIARPGYGDSSPSILESFAGWAELISPLTRELKLDQFDILGMSSGAPYGYSIASRFSHQVRNLYVFSGIPALYDEVVLSHWPYEMNKNASFEDMERLAHELFFSNLTADDLKQKDIRDSMRNRSFGVAQDLWLRTRDWGFRLSDVRAKVFMRHSKCDDSVAFETAVRTAELLPNCELELLETGPHFSKEALDDFIRTMILKHIKL